MCTPFAPDGLVHSLDLPGFRMIPAFPSVPKARNPVLFPPRARHTPRQRGFCFIVLTKVDASL
jgi:hypothetical protein